MKKTIWIGIAVVGIVAAFLLVKETKSDVALEATPAPVSHGQKNESMAPTQTAGTVDSSGRIPLPNPEVPKVTPELVPVHLHPLFGWKDIGGYVPRRRMVEALGEKLSAEEIRSLIGFARSRPEEVGLSDHDFNGVGDVVLLKLEAQSPLPAEYTDHLTVMFYDESLNAIWRDYCIQHLGTVYSRTPEEKRPVIRQLYADAIQPGSRFAGTALLAMKRSVGTPDMPEKFVAEQAMAVASSDAFDEAERLSGLAVASELKHPEALELARQVVDSKHTAAFRMAALAVLGKNGDATDRPLLENYVNSSDIRLRVAAVEALKSLNR